MGPSGPEGHRGPSGQPVRILKHCAVKKNKFYSVYRITARVHVCTVFRVNLENLDHRGNRDHLELQ